MILYLIKKREPEILKSGSQHQKSKKNESELLCYLIIYED